MSEVVSPIPHGTAYGYQRFRCRCDACREAEVARQRAWRARLRAGKVQHRPNHPACVPVRVRGQDFPSITAAAGALGVNPASIGSQLRTTGAAEGAGLGAKAPRRRALNNAKPCRIHGRDFPSRAAAARYLGVSLTYLHRSISRGFSPTYAEFLLVKLMAADARGSGK